MYQVFLTTEHWNIVGLGETEQEAQKNILDVIKNDYGYELSANDLYERYGAFTSYNQNVIMWTNNCIAPDNSIEI